MIKVSEMISVLDDSFFDVIEIDGWHEEHHGEIDESSYLWDAKVSSVMPIVDEDGEIVVNIYVDMSDDA
jgi:hypothetical protein